MPVVTVTPRPFYVPARSGDDATNLIQGALDRGHPVNLGPGVFTTTGITLKNGSTLRGAGDGLTTLRLAAGSSTDLVTTEGFATYTGTNVRSGPEAFTVQDINLDGNKANVSSGWVFRVYGCAYRISNVTFRNGKSGLVFSEWGPGGSEMEAQFVNFRLDVADGKGMDWRGPHDSQFLNGIVSGMDGYDAVTTSGNATSEQFTNIHIWGLNSNGFVLGKAAYLANCQAEGATGANVLFKAGGVTWVGGTVFGTASGTEAGFQWGTGTEGIIGGIMVMGVRLYNFGATGRPLYLVNTTAGTVVDATLFAGSVTTAITGTAAATDSIRLTSNDNQAVTQVGTRWTQHGRMVHHAAASGMSQAYTLKTSGGGSDIINFNASGRRLELPQADLRFYTDQYSTQTLEVNNAGFIEGVEISDPSAPSSNRGRLYFKDNGSGKTQLAVRFPTGAVQVIATEP